MRDFGEFRLVARCLAWGGMLSAPMMSEGRCMIIGHEAGSGACVAESLAHNVHALTCSHQDRRVHKCSTTTPSPLVAYALEAASMGRYRLGGGRSTHAHAHRRLLRSNTSSNAANDRQGCARAIRARWLERWSDRESIRRSDGKPMVAFEATPEMSWISDGRQVALLAQYRGSTHRVWPVAGTVAGELLP
jgi:hypothetical protein